MPLLRDTATVALKEWKDMLQVGSGRLSGPVPLFAGMGVAAVFLANGIGAEYPGSWQAVFLAASTAAVSTASVVADSVAGERERHTLDTLLATRLPDAAIALGKVAGAVGHGLAVSAWVLLVGLVATRVAHGPPPAGTHYVRLLHALGFGFLASVLVAAVGFLASMNAPTVKQAQQTAMVTLMLLLIAPFAVLRVLDDTQRARLARWAAEGAGGHLPLAAAALLALLAAAAVAGALSRFPRARGGQ
jgi:ABC-2 type transport system permease protein